MEAELLLAAHSAQQAFVRAKTLRDADARR
jgi:hypothetical protein